jgi:hypothetical protein
MIDGYRENGIKYNGTWQDGEMHGTFEVEDLDGHKRTEKYERGKIVTE